MSARKVFFAGRVIGKPGSYSVQDASGLEATTLAATGIVLLIGEGEGGQPYTVPDGDGAKIDKFKRSSAKAMKTYRSGDLREAVPLAFNPGNDPQIPSGASEVWTLKVNPSTPSTGTISAALGPVSTLTTEGYGAFTEQTNYSIAVGAGGGTNRLYSFTLEDVSEGENDVGGEAFFTLRYTESPGFGWDAMTAAKRNGGLRAWGTRVELGRFDAAGEIILQPTSGDVICVLTVIADIGRTITLYGRDVAGLTQTETILITVTGGAGNIGTKTWSALHGVLISGTAAAGATTVRRNTSGGSVLATLTGQIARGIAIAQTMFVANLPVQLAAASTETTYVTLVGRDSAGVVATELLRLGGVATQAVQSVTSWSRLDYIALGGVLIATSVTISALVINTSDTVQKTLLQLSDFVNARSTVISSVRYGFTMTLVTSQTGFDPDDLDFTGAPVAIQAAAGSFYADHWSFLDLVNNRAQLVDATILPWVAAAWNITISPVDSTAYSIVLDGVTCALTAAEVGVGATATSIATLFAARIMLDPRFSRVWRADVVTAGVLRVSTLGPNTATATVGANLAIAVYTTASGVKMTPQVTDTTYLSGGIEGVTTIDDWIGAFDFAAKLRPNKIVPLSSDAAVHALFDAHLAYMRTIGRHEREGAVGLENTSGGLATLSEIRDQVALLNNSDMQAVVQEFDTFATDATITAFGPKFLAVLLMGAKCGAGIGGSLTGRYMNVQAMRSHATVDPTGDGETLSDYGACVMERIDGRGYRVVRNVTTYLATTSLVYSEAHVNEAANRATLTIREGMEYLVGRKGFARTEAAAEGTAEKLAEELMSPRGGEIISDYRAIDVDLTADVLELSMEIAPVISLNFILNTLHLVLARTAA